jgi:hypothetical protein
MVNPHQDAYKKVFLNKCLNFELNILEINLTLTTKNFVFFSANSYHLVIKFKRKIWEVDLFLIKYLLRTIFK